MIKMFNFSPILLLFSIFMFFNFFTKKEISHSSNYPDLSLVKPLTRAFSHNDYEQDAPLFSALSEGFTYIEADVHLINKNLFISHYRPLIINQEKNLSQLYLKPLFEIFKMNNGRIFPQSDQPIYLVVDFKTNAKKTLAALQEILIPYHAMLTRWEDGNEITGAVTILISGNRPIKQLLEKEKRWVCLDGRLEDIGQNYSPSLMPIISDKYSKVFGWTIFSKPPSQEKLLHLHQVANNIHAEGKKFRLWKSPENELVWNAMLEAGVDVINTDSLIALSNYFYKKEASIPMAGNNE